MQYNAVQCSALYIQGVSTDSISAVGGACPACSLPQADSYPAGVNCTASAADSLWLQGASGSTAVLPPATSSLSRASCTPSAAESCLLCAIDHYAQGEMSATIMRYASDYVNLLPALRQRILGPTDNSTTSVANTASGSSVKAMSRSAATQPPADVKFGESQQVVLSTLP